MTGVLVVDASVATKWLLREVDSDAATVLLSDVATLRAPEIVRVEVAAALTKHVVADLVDAGDALLRLARLDRIFDDIVPNDHLLADGVALAAELGHHLFDCLYLALALRDDARLVTADIAFTKKAAAAGHAASVVLLGDFALSSGNEGPLSP